jgi:hypothetical protein
MSIQWKACERLEGWSAFDFQGCEILYDTRDEAEFSAKYLNKHEINAKFRDIDPIIEEIRRLYALTFLPFMRD